MAVRGVDFKWYDGFFLSMLATSVIIVAINWGKYDLCTYPLHIWIVVDYSIVFVFRLLMFVDNGLSAGMGLDFGSQQRYARFCGRVLVLSILAFILYPFLWTWNVIGIRWFSRGQDCLPVQGQKWGFLIWLLFSYCGLICIAGLCIRKWLARRQALVQRAQQGLPISEIGVLLDMIRVPEWAFEAAGQELQLMGQDAGYHPGLYLTPTQREAVEVLIQDLPKFRLKAVPADCCECPICLEEFQMGDEVRGLPCAHNFHVACIDEWLRLNVKCPRCRSSVFPNLDLRAISNLPPDSSALSAPSVVTTSQLARSQTASQSHFRFPGLLIPIRSGNAGIRVAANPLTVDMMKQCDEMCPCYLSIRLSFRIKHILMISVCVCGFALASWPGFLYVSIISVIGIILALAGSFVILAARVAMLTWITVLVLLACSGKRRQSLVLDGKKITIDVALQLVEVFNSDRSRIVIAAACATVLSIIAKLGIRETCKV